MRRVLAPVAAVLASACGLVLDPTYRVTPAEPGRDATLDGRGDAEPDAPGIDDGVDVVEAGDLDAPPVDGGRVDAARDAPRLDVAVDVPGSDGSSDADTSDVPAFDGSSDTGDGSPLDGVGDAPLFDGRDVCDCVPIHGACSSTCDLVCDGGWGDCDDDGATGCETALDTLTDCGSCGAVCAPYDLPGTAEVTCAGGTCAAVACLPSWGDCDGDLTDGCEHMWVVYPDGDGDGVGISTGELLICGIDPGPGYAFDDGDCCDTDPDVFPGQTEFFGAQGLCGDWDYDCDGVEQEEYAVQGSCGGTACDHVVGFADAVPACGEMGTLIVGCVPTDTPPGGCITGMAADETAQGCR